MPEQDGFNADFFSPIVPLFGDNVFSSDSSVCKAAALRGLHMEPFFIMIGGAMKSYASRAVTLANGREVTSRARRSSTAFRAVNATSFVLLPMPNALIVSYPSASVSWSSDELMFIQLTDIGIVQRIQVTLFLLQADGSLFEARVSTLPVPVTENIFYNKYSPSDSVRGVELPGFSTFGTARYVLQVLPDNARGHVNERMTYSVPFCVSKSLEPRGDDDNDLTEKRLQIDVHVNRADDYSPPLPKEDNAAGNNDDDASPSVTHVRWTEELVFSWPVGDLVRNGTVDMISLSLDLTISTRKDVATYPVGTWMNITYTDEAPSPPLPPPSLSPSPRSVSTSPSESTSTQTALLVSTSASASTLAVNDSSASLSASISSQAHASAGNGASASPSADGRRRILEDASATTSPTTTTDGVVEFPSLFDPNLKLTYCPGTQRFWCVRWKVDTLLPLQKYKVEVVQQRFNETEFLYRDLSKDFVAVEWSEIADKVATSSSSSSATENPAPPLTGAALPAAFVDIHIQDDEGVPSDVARPCWRCAYAPFGEFGLFVVSILVVIYGMVCLFAVLKLLHKASVNVSDFIIISFADTGLTHSSLKERMELACLSWMHKENVNAWIKYRSYLRQEVSRTAWIVSWLVTLTAFAALSSGLAINYFVVIKQEITVFIYYLVPYVIFLTVTSLGLLAALLRYNELWASMGIRFKRLKSQLETSLLRVRGKDLPATFVVNYANIRSHVPADTMLGASAASRDEVGAAGAATAATATLPSSIAEEKTDASVVAPFGTTAGEDDGGDENGHNVDDGEDAAPLLRGGEPNSDAVRDQQRQYAAADLTLNDFCGYREYVIIRSEEDKASVEAVLEQLSSLIDNLELPQNRAGISVLGIYVTKASLTAVQGVFATLLTTLVLSPAITYFKDK
jgi:hypothetical protein